MQQGWRGGEGILHTSLKNVVGWTGLQLVVAYGYYSTLLYHPLQLFLRLRPPFVSIIPKPYSQYSVQLVGITEQKILQDLVSLCNHFCKASFLLPINCYLTYTQQKARVSSECHPSKVIAISAQVSLCNDLSSSLLPSLPVCQDNTSSDQIPSLPIFI